MSAAEAEQRLRELVLDLVRAAKPPVHVAALSMTYAKRAGHSIKQDYKGGMLRFLKDKCSDAVVLMGEGNDTFVRVATPTTLAANWVRACVLSNGPILASMVGRLYQEAHAQPFSATFPEGIVKFMRGQLATELSFEPQKGIEVLVDLQRRGDARAFLAADSKKQRKAKLPQRAEAADGEAPPSPAGASASASVGAEVGGRLGARGMPSAYAQPEERVLVLGEADFSWSASLLALCAPGVRRRRLTVTSFDSRETLRTKYGAASVDGHIERLKAAGASVLHGIDATQLGERTEITRRAPYDVIAFVFPHAGGDAGLAASIDQNRALLATLIREQAPPLLPPGGEVHITLVHRYPYTAWLTALTTPPEPPPAAAKKKTNKPAPPPAAETTQGGSAAAATLPAAPLAYLGATPFDFGAFSGYQHRATSRVDGGDAGALDVATRCLTHVWGRTDATGGASAAAAPDAQTSSAPAGAAAVRASRTQSTGEESHRKKTKKRKRSRDEQPSGRDPG